MNKQAWTLTKDLQEVHRRAGGRRRYNAKRQRLADKRLIPLVHWLAATGDLESALGKGLKPHSRHPLIPALAKVLGVHRTTVWRDAKRLRGWRYHLLYRGATDRVDIWLPGFTRVSYILGDAIEVQAISKIYRHGKWNLGELFQVLRRQFPRIAYHLYFLTDDCVRRTLLP